MRSEGIGIALVLAALLACGGGSSNDPIAKARDRVSRCQLYDSQVAELAQDLRYGKIEPWKARGEMNKITDKRERLDCANAVRDLGALLRADAEPVAAPPPAPSRRKKSAKVKPATKPGCEGLDPEVCEALATPGASTQAPP